MAQDAQLTRSTERRHRKKSAPLSVPSTALRMVCRKMVSMSNHNPERIWVFKSKRAEGLTKQRIRSRILLRLKIQKEEDRKAKSKVIQEKLFRSLVFKKAKVIMFYVAFGGEVDTKEMIRQAQIRGKIVAVPVCAKKRNIRPTLFNYRARLRKGPYGIYEPAMKRFIDLKNLDLVVVPGLAFDKKGNRLGRGKGYYDRFLEKPATRPPSVGLAFDFQILPSVPTTPLDMRVDRVIFA